MPAEAVSIWRQIRELFLTTIHELAQILANSKLGQELRYIETIKAISDEVARYSALEFRDIYD